MDFTGKGDYFPVHVDSRLVEMEEVKAFVQPYPGGGAIGVRLKRGMEPRRSMRPVFPTTASGVCAGRISTKRCKRRTD